MNILIVEDDTAIREGLEYCLKSEGFKVKTASTGEEAKQKLNHVDLILLDINLPDSNGFTLFPEIQKQTSAPVIFLTANDLETSIVMGLDMGAFDYVTKPFKTRELISRIKNALRKSQVNTIQIQNIQIDLNQAKVFKNGVDVMLTNLEYKILLTLALHPNVVFTREKLLADIWDVSEEYVYDNTLTVYIKRIREKIEDDIAHPKIIETVRKVGYKIGDRNES